MPEIWNKFNLEMMMTLFPKISEKCTNLEVLVLNFKSRVSEFLMMKSRSRSFNQVSVSTTLVKIAIAIAVWFRNTDKGLTLISNSKTLQESYLVSVYLHLHISSYCRGSSLLSETGLSSGYCWSAAPGIRDDNYPRMYLPRWV